MANPDVAVLEQGIKEQARQMSQRPEVSAPPIQTMSGATQCLLWIAGTAGGVIAGLVTVVGLRRWNRWLDRPASLGSTQSLMAEDPALVEFLRSLRESSDSAPLPANPPVPSTQQELLTPSVAGPRPEPSEPGAEAIAQIGQPLTTLRASFAKLGRAADDAQRLSVLHEIAQHVQAIKDGSSLPHLRAAWLLASALHGLLKQLSTKVANITPSSLRTVGTAIDSLELLFRSNVRPNLASSPPVRLLAVDDDPISRRAVSVALKKAFNDTDLACDGPNALEMVRQKPYDLIFLDVEMPGLDGFEVCSRIHETEINRNTPVVFVTSHTDFDARAKSARVGAHDLIGKPFLAFEITVKALTLILKARLQDCGIATESQPSPRSMPAPQSDPGKSGTPVPLAVPSADEPAPKASQPSAAPCPLSVAKPTSREFARAFFKEAPAHVRLLHNKLSSLDGIGPGVEREDLLGELFIGVHAICAQAGHAQLDAAFRVSSALEAMLKKLVEHPGACTASAFHTSTVALQTIEQLCRREEDLDLTAVPARLLVVDDDPVARRAIGGALQLAFGRPDSADCGEAALVLAAEKAYDLILLDVIMPGMDGFDTCSKLHELELNRQTPVVFVTSQDDLDSRTQAAVSGGAGFIPKPVLPCEIMVLALAYGVRTRLQRPAGDPWENAARLATCASALAS